MHPSTVHTPQQPAAVRRLTARRLILRWLLLLMLPLLAAAPAQADTCGADGGRPCTVTERMPSCNLNLSESGGRGYRAACGAEGQRGCGPTERIMFDFILQLPVPPTARNGCCVSGTKGVVRIAQRLR